MIPLTPARIMECLLLTLLSIILALVITFAAAHINKALAHEYARPDLNQWYDALKQPDQPTVSCCGGFDAYWADRVDECGPGDIPAYSRGECVLVAIITDTREISGRPVVPVGTRVPIPSNKIRKHPSENPTDHNVVFMSAVRFVYCWEPLALI